MENILPRREARENAFLLAFSQTFGDIPLQEPLMGPIVGMGYSLAVGDTALIRQAMRNIIIFVVISVITATLYFLLTPLKDAQSELLARTQPTLWDVLIAFFGGSAGIVALTRKEGGNAIPGVAIATALMPPLCTAGYGLAHGNWHYFLGASYLFAINCVSSLFRPCCFPSCSSCRAGGW